MFVSVGVRFEANVEALNMVETAGNYSKHRRVPYIVTEENETKTVYVPAISGESLGHAFQEFLVNEAKAVYDGTCPVCPSCNTYTFYKSMDKLHFEEKMKILDDPAFLRSILLDPKIPSLNKKKKELTPQEIEKIILASCLIEDIGGFLYAQKPPVRRTSAFQVSYALPIKAHALYATTDPQLHARHAQLTENKKSSGGASEQMIYYVEIGTAIYGFTINLDLDAIGISAVTGEPLLTSEEKKRRSLIAIRALTRMLSSQQFGAKLSRFFPTGGIISMMITLTSQPFSVTSPIYDDYELHTINRLEALRNIFSEEDILAFTYNMDETQQLEEAPDFVSIHDTGEDALLALMETVEEMFE